VIVTDSEGRYAGIAYPAEAFGMAGGAQTVADILHHEEHFLLPEMTVKDTLAALQAAEADALAVLDGPQTRQVLGLLTEQYALRRYNEELERRRREISGE
jgi:CIC family chloride channel protein